MSDFYMLLLLIFQVWILCNASESEHGNIIIPVGLSICAASLWLFWWRTWIFPLCNYNNIKWSRGNTEISWQCCRFKVFFTWLWWAWLDMNLIYKVILFKYFDVFILPLNHINEATWVQMHITNDHAPDYIDINCLH